jgi:hypothetical protein
MSKHSIKLDRVVLVKLPNGEKFFLEYFGDGLLIHPKGKYRKIKVEKYYNDIIVKLK